LPGTQEYRLVLAPDHPALEKRSLKPADSSTMICMTAIIGDTHVASCLKIDKIHHGSGASFNFTNCHIAAAWWYLLSLLNGEYSETYPGWLAKHEINEIISIGKAKRTGGYINIKTTGKSVKPISPFFNIMILLQKQCRDEAAAASTMFHPCTALFLYWVFLGPLSCGYFDITILLPFLMRVVRMGMNHSTSPSGHFFPGHRSYNGEKICTYHGTKIKNR
jgi:hypothetical protein